MIAGRLARAGLLLRLAAASAWNRRATLALTVFAVALSVAMLLAVGRTREAAHAGFTGAVSGTDLVVGARTSPLSLVLQAVFRIGDPVAEMSWSSFRRIAQHPAVAWTIPIALGDSHRGFPVLGTNDDYLRHFRYGDRRALAVETGAWLADRFDVVLGAEVASRLGYRPGDRIVVSHGHGAARLPSHDDRPFRVSGILARTGTPVDRTLHVGLEAIEAIHLDWQGGVRLPGVAIPADQLGKFDLTPERITAMLLGLKTRTAVFQVRQAIENDADEALVAALPGLALEQLWRTLDGFERTLTAVSALVVTISLAGLVAVVLAGLGERRRELAILRSVGAGPADIAGLLLIEGLLVTIAGCVAGLALLALALAGAGPLIEARFGLALPLGGSPAAQWPLLAAVVGCGGLAALLPAWRASRMALADGLTPRL